MPLLISTFEEKSTTLLRPFWFLETTYFILENAASIHSSTDRKEYQLCSEQERAL